MKRLLILFLTLNIPAFLYAQEQVEMADTMRSEGKIYVVVAIILAILFGIIAYLFMLERKMTRLEDQIKAKQ